MKDKFLLYIDVLGFANLVKERVYEIDDLYEVIASLHVHNHPAFKVVVFSDTILVYNLDGGDSPLDSSYLLMFLCEFAKDIMHRLTKKGIYFRAIVTKGGFTHYVLNEVPCFFGQALIDAYNSEKEIKAIGLFLDKRIEKFCDIFKYTSFNKDFNFVYMTQALDKLELYGRDGFPINNELIEHTEEIWMIVPELIYIKEIYSLSNSDYPDLIKVKYEATWAMYQKQYPKITKFLIDSDLDISSFSPKADWQAVISRYPSDYRWAIKSKQEF